MLYVIVTVIIGILYTVRKLDVRRRGPEDYPHVARADFDRWQRLESGAYTIGSVACFAKVLLDYGFVYAAERYAIAPNVIRVVGFSLFASWVAAMVIAWRRGNAGRKLREQLGIDLVGRPPTGSPQDPSS